MKFNLLKLCTKQYSKVKYNDWSLFSVWADISFIDHSVYIKSYCGSVYNDIIKYGTIASLSQDIDSARLNDF